MYVHFKLITRPFPMQRSVKLEESNDPKDLFPKYGKRPVYFSGLDFRPCFPLGHISGHPDSGGSERKRTRRQERVSGRKEIAIFSGPIHTKANTHFSLLPFSCFTLEWLLMNG